MAKDNNVEGLKRLRKKLESMLSDLGMHDGTHIATCTSTWAWPSRPRRTRRAPAGSAPTPTARCSTSTARPTTLDNLYVVDSSFFVSIGAVNPTLTIIANALRVGDHLVSRLG